MNPTRAMVEAMRESFVAQVEGVWNLDETDAIIIVFEKAVREGLLKQLEVMELLQGGRNG